MPSRARPAWRPPPPDTSAAKPAYVRPTVVSIDPTAGRGQAGLSIGDRITIQSGGLYAGEQGRIERFAGGAIPAAVVRTDAGKLRHVRTIDVVRTPAAAADEGS